jgi:hypothetical protein
VCAGGIGCSKTGAWIFATDGAVGGVWGAGGGAADMGAGGATLAVAETGALAARPLSKLWIKLVGLKPWVALAGANDAPANGEIGAAAGTDAAGGPGSLPVGTNAGGGPNAIGGDTGVWGGLDGCAAAPVICIVEPGAGTACGWGTPGDLYSVAPLIFIAEPGASVAWDWSAGSW